MDIIYATELLRGLADGINPLTGEQLDPMDSCNQPDIIRALHTAVAILEKKAENTKKLPENAGKPWTAEDEAILAKMFDDKCSSKEICDYFKRTKGAISSRLARMGKIQDRDSWK